MAKDDPNDREIAAKVAELKAKATPDKIKRMAALFQAEVDRRDAAKKAGKAPVQKAAPKALPPRPTASAQAPERPLAAHALEILKRWRPKN